MSNLSLYSNLFGSLLGYDYYEPPLNSGYYFYLDKDNDNLYKLELALPGYKKENTKLTIQNRQLKLEATKNNKTYKNSIILPKVLDTSTCKATLQDGVLTVSMLVRKEDNSDVIEVPLE